MTRKRPRRKIKLGRTAFLCVLLASFIAIGAVLGFVVGAVRNMPNYDLENITGDLSSFIIDKDNKEVTALRTMKNRVELEPDEIPTVMKEAIISIEDQRFYKHRGIDLWRLGGAVIANIREGYGSEGGSTITQQLVKQAILENPEKKLRRKVQEAIIALRVESLYRKDEILTMYLNNVYYGHNAWSLETAAQTYFGKKAKDLNLAEASMLAGVVNAPNRYSPYLNMEKGKQRQSLVLSEMVKMGFITREEANNAKAETLNLVGLKTNSYSYQSFVDYVIEEAAAALNMDNENIAKLYTAGYKIYTTMDTKAQNTAETVYADDKNFPPNKGDRIVQSAMVVLDPHSGEIRCLIGGRNQKGERQFNRAVNATRQPGSAFKPIAVYGPALEKGYGPATVLDDYPENYNTPAGPKTFVNYDNRYRGLISMRTAIQYSVNTVAVKMLQKIGIEEGFRFAEKLGITTLVDSGKANDMGLSLALGGLTKGVSPLELAGAYGTYANQGVYIKPFAIRKIEDKDGRVLYEHKTMKTIVTTPQTAFLMSNMMRSVVEAGTATRAKLDRPVAGKTGTTSNDVDAWFVGFTPDLVGVVWLGFDKEESMSGVFGGSAGAPIWSKIMTVAHEGIPISSFPMPEGITNIAVDYKSGLLPSTLTPPEYVTNEYFNSSYVPTEISNVWMEMPVCAESGELLTSDCPYPVTRPFLKRQVPWTGTVVPEDANLEPPTSYCSVHGGGAPIQMGISLQGSLVSANNNVRTRLNWYKPGAKVGTIYEIYRSDRPDVAVVPANKVGEVSDNASSWIDENTPEANQIYYRVVAHDPETAEQTVSNVVPIKLKETDENNLTAPNLTGNAVVNGNDVSVQLSWTKPAGNRPLIYFIFRSETPNFQPNSQNQIAINEMITDNLWTDKGLSRHKAYYYKVVGFDTSTNRQSPFSNQLMIQIN